MKLSNEDIYDIIYEEIVERFNNGELTLEQASDVLDQALYEFIESGDDDQFLVLNEKVSIKNIWKKQGLDYIYIKNIIYNIYIYKYFVIKKNEFLSYIY